MSSASGASSSAPYSPPSESSNAQVTSVVTGDGVHMTADAPSPSGASSSSEFNPGETEQASSVGGGDSGSFPRSAPTTTQLSPDGSTAAPSSTDVEPGSIEESSGVPTEEALGAVALARGEHGVGALNGEVYLLGGFTPSVTSKVHAYSPSTDSWREVRDFPVVFHHPNVATVGDKLYVLGFHAGSGQRRADGSSYAYDAEVDEWTAVSPMLPGTERGASCVTVYKEKVYLFGGTNDVALPDASTYDPATDQWDTLPFLPATRHHCVAAALNDKIYIVSGRDVVIEEVQAESYVFDPATQKYTEVAPILTPRGGAAGALLGGKIYVFGGEGNVNDPRGIFHEAEVYDPATDMWASLPDMSVPRHGLGAVVIDGKLHLPAGSVSQGIDVVDTHTVFYLK